MFTIAGVLKMFGSKLEEIINNNNGKLTLTVDVIEKWCVKEKIPFKLTLTNNGIVIVKR